MKKLPFGIFKIAVLSLIFILVVILLLPFDLFDIEQAQRIAKWKSTYEKLEYSFSLVNLHEGSIIPSALEAEKIIDDDFILSRLIPYLNIDQNNISNFSKYKYRKMNGRKLFKKSQFNFDRLIKRKDGITLGIKENLTKSNTDNKPLYFMFVDINGSEKPNMIGKDIFFISIFKNKISALGNGKTHAQLKTNCSPVGGGFYCSEYYLLGGKF